MNKNRISVPTKIAAEILIANKHACCVCQDYHVQLHHIDENPSNNDPANLAVLCLKHHDLATMKMSISRKLGQKEIRQFKSDWETRCENDVLALSRDRLRYYVTLYKNPPRIRELFGRLSIEQRHQGFNKLQKEIQEDINHHKTDLGFQWQALPGENDLTVPLLHSILAGDFWPRMLPRVTGHSDDPDYPINLAPPYGMTAFHGFDLYCQLMTRCLASLSFPYPLELLWKFNEPDLIDKFAGSLITFREHAIGKSIVSPRSSQNKPLGRVQFRFQKSGKVFKALMVIKNMYVFSDTAAENLRNSKVCGIAILEDAKKVKVKNKLELHIGLKPLLIGMGGLGQSEDGWWNFDKAQLGSKS